MGKSVVTNRKSKLDRLRDTIRTNCSTIRLKLKRPDKSVFWYDNMQKLYDLMQLSILIIDDELDVEDCTEIIGLYNVSMFITGNLKSQDSTSEKRMIVNESFGEKIDLVRASFESKYRGKIAFMDIKNEIKKYKLLTKIIREKILNLKDVNSDEQLNCVMQFNTLSLLIMRFDMLIVRLSGDNSLTIQKRIERRESIVDIFGKLQDVFKRVQNMTAFSDAIEEFSQAINEYHEKYQDILVFRKFSYRGIR